MPIIDVEKLLAKRRLTLKERRQPFRQVQKKKKAAIKELEEIVRALENHIHRATVAKDESPFEDEAEYAFIKTVNKMLNSEAPFNFLGDDATPTLLWADPSFHALEDNTLVISSFDEARQVLEFADKGVQSMWEVVAHKFKLRAVCSTYRMHSDHGTNMNGVRVDPDDWVVTHAIDNDIGLLDDVLETSTVSYVRDPALLAQDSANIVANQEIIFCPTGILSLHLVVAELRK